MAMFAMSTSDRMDGLLYFLGRQLRKEGFPITMLDQLERDRHHWVKGNSVDCSQFHTYFFLLTLAVFSLPFTGK